MSRYVEILAVDRPFPFDVDDNRRTLFSTNFAALAVGPVSDFEEEIAAFIVSGGLGALGSDLFIGPASVVPSGDGPYTTLIGDGGLPPTEIHNGTRYERIALQVIVRAKSFDAARDRALAIWRLLDGTRE